GEVVGVDVVDGTERYRVRLGRLVRSSPLPWQDRVFVGTVDDKGAGGVASLDAAKGKLLWMRKTGPVFSSPALAGDTILVGSDGPLYLRDAEGRVLHQVSLSSQGVQSPPALDGDAVAVGSAEGLHGLRLTP